MIKWNRVRVIRSPWVENDLMIQSGREESLGVSRARANRRQDARHPKAFPARMWLVSDRRDRAHDDHDWNGRVDILSSLKLMLMSRRRREALSRPSLVVIGCPDEGQLGQAGKPTRFESALVMPTCWFQSWFIFELVVESKNHSDSWLGQRRTSLWVELASAGLRASDRRVKSCQQPIGLSVRLLPYVH